MEKIVFVDTNFLINNIGNIKKIISEMEQSGYLLYITQTVKIEFINIQLRKLKETYSKLEKIKQTNKHLNISYVKEDKSLKSLEEAYNRLFDKYFENKIIEYDKSDMLDRVLERNKFKRPPFYNEPNSTDKGFKDTIIYLTIRDYIQTLPEGSEIYFITSDNGFIKYKDDLEPEVFKETKRNIKFIEGNSKEFIYSQLKIDDENEERQEENIFAKNKEKIDIEKIREEINELIYIFKYENFEDYYGNQIEEKRFELYLELNYNDTEYLLNNIECNLKKNIFNNYISVEKLFKNSFMVSAKYDIDVTILQKIYDIYIKVRETEYKDAFINFIMTNVNENIDSSIKNGSSNDDIPF